MLKAYSLLLVYVFAFGYKERDEKPVEKSCKRKRDEGKTKIQNRLTGLFNFNPDSSW